MSIDDLPPKDSRVSLSADAVSESDVSVSADAPRQLSDSGVSKAEFARQLKVVDKIIEENDDILERLSKT